MVATGERGFDLLRQVCRDQRDASSFRCDDLPLERLRRAFLDSGLSREERLVRLRHALRFASTSHEFGGVLRTFPLLPMDRTTPDLELARFGLVRRASGEVVAQPWVPDWLTDVLPHGADYRSMQEAHRPWTSLSPLSDPWVRKHQGFDSYRGPGQALAVRSVLHLPVGETLVVVLPTGEGKSLVFHALANAHPSQTVAVVVPTVALAIDQELFLRHRDPSQVRYHAYVGGDERRATAITASLRDGQPGLLFAAPEAFASSLREPLLQAARAGRLACLVIDEAHLVDAWGTDFRSAFQWLGALVAELRAIAPTGAKPRVVCLSATLNQLAFDTIEALFSPSQAISVVAATRLRPEQDLWIAPMSASEEVRVDRVISAIRSLPRPAVLYVTRREDAENWRHRLLTLGFRRVGVVHGDTDAATREQVLQQWRTGELDLVVGTSAFGLGIDFAHVRTIIHACIPETLDRYYQEIGRSGRDNHCAIAVLVPAHSDVEMAKRLSRKTVISEEKGLARWTALFRAAPRCEGPDHRVLVDIAASPGYEPDMRSGRNEDWNVNVLNLLVRAGVIRYAGLQRRKEDDRLLLAVDICDQRHLDSALWEERVKPLRERVAAENRRAHAGVLSLLRNQSCPSKLFEGMYRLHYRGVEYPVTLACGGCPVCRRSNADGWFAQWPSAPRAPFPVGCVASRLQQFMDRQGRLFVGYSPDTILSRRLQRQTRQWIEVLWRLGLRKFVMVGEGPTALIEALEQQPWCVATAQNGLVIASSGLPPGPMVVWFGENQSMPVAQLGASALGVERVIFLPLSMEDPRNPGSLLAERVNLTVFDTMLEQLNQ